MYYLYVATAFPPIDDTVKIGISGNVRERIGNYNCSSPRPWGAVYWDLKEPEYWEGELKNIYKPFLKYRGYDTEIIDVVAASNNTKALTLAARNNTVRSLLWWTMYYASVFCNRLGHLPNLYCDTFNKRHRDILLREQVIFPAGKSMFDLCPQNDDPFIACSDEHNRRNMAWLQTCYAVASDSFLDELERAYADIYKQEP